MKNMFHSIWGVLIGDRGWERQQAKGSFSATQLSQTEGRITSSAPRASKHRAGEVARWPSSALHHVHQHERLGRLMPAVRLLTERSMQSGTVPSPNWEPMMPPQKT